MRFFRWGLYVLVTLWLLIIVLLWFALNQLFDDSRDIDPQARYAKIMTSPADYGVSIDKIPCANEADALNLSQLS